MVFDVNRWFDKAEEDGAIERELLPTGGVGADGTNWRLIVVTCEQLPTYAAIGVVQCVVGTSQATRSAWHVLLHGHSHAWRG